MDVRCERCRAQYVFDDDQVTPSGLTVQCTNCGHLFKVKKKELVVTVPVKPDELEGTPLPATAAAPRAGGPAEAPHAPEPRGREWRVRQPNGNVFTFRELTTLQKWIVERKVSRDDEISQEGAPWKRLGNIGELASFFQVVEAAERAKVQAPAVTPVPLASVTAVYGAPLPLPASAVPPPPSGFPPPSFTRPVHPPPAPAPVAAPPPARAAAPAPAIPGAEDDAALAGVKRSRGGRIAIAVAAGVIAAGALAYLLRPGAPEVGPAPSPPAESIAVPLTIEVKPRAVVEAPAATPGDAPNAAASEAATGTANGTAAGAGNATAMGSATATSTPTANSSPTPTPTSTASPAAPAEAAPTPLPAPVLLAEPAPEPKAVAVARGVEQLAAASKKPATPSSPKALLAQADRVRQRGDAERALDLYGRLVANDPDNAAALAGRGLCYLDLEQYAPAEASFQAALRAAPGLPDALMGLAETYRGRGRKSEALQYYEQYLALHPDGEEAAVARNAIEELRR